MPEKPPREESSSGYPFAPNRKRVPERDSWETPPPGALDDATDPGIATPGAIPRIYLDESSCRIPIQSDSAIAATSGDDIPLGTSPTASERMIGPYIVVRTLAKGGMGEVLLGQDPALRRAVAIKVLSEDLLEDEDALARFRREAMAAASLKHPNVAMIYFVELAAGKTPYIAMEYVEGGSLERLIRERIRLPYSRAADVMIQVAEALRAAYRQGIIHRDVKPGNIMLTNDGQVKVVDFGLAKFNDQATHLTAVGMIMGTPRYMAPEQTRGLGVDYRADIYSLGATFYHVLTGRAPFEGDSPPQIMMKHVNTPLVPMRSINPDVPMEFDDIIRKCMMKDPGERYQDYSDLISDLAHVKLQYTARERGAGISSLDELPTVRLGADGMPLAPGEPTHGSRTSQSALRSSGVREILPPEVHEPVPLWRVALIGAAVLVLLCGLLYAIFGGSEEPPPAPVAPGEKSRLQVLLERLVEEQAPAANATPQDPGSRPDPEFLRYRATAEILAAFGEGLLVFSSSEGRDPDSLVELAASDLVTEIFDRGPGGAPLDGWERPLGWSAADRVIFSAGIDGRPHTADDIEVGLDGVLSIADPAPYEKLEEAEERRQSGQ